MIAATGLLLAACAGCKQASRGVDGGTWEIDRAWKDGKPPEELGRPRSGGTLVVRAPKEPVGLNLLDDAMREPWAVRMTRNLVYESLLEVDPVVYKLKPLLAESITFDATGRKYKIRLKPALTFSDGSPLTADDVLAAIDAVMDPTHPTRALRDRFKGMSVWQKTGPLELEVQWWYTEALSLRNLATLPIYPRSSLQGDFEGLPLARAPIGTGPYAVTEWKPGERLVLTRNPLSATGAFLDRIVFRFVPDDALALAMFEKGELDLLTDVPPETWRALEAPDPKNRWAQQGAWRYFGLQNNLSFIAWNTTLPGLSEPAVRQAFARVYPAKKVFETVDHGLELPTTCPYFSAGYGCDRAIVPWSYDPSAARGLLADAGFADADGDGLVERDGVPLQLTFVAPEAPPRAGKIAPLLKEELRKIGAGLEIETVSPEALEARVRERAFGAVLRERSDEDAETDLFDLLHSDGGTNIGGYRAVPMDVALETTRYAPGPNTRNRLEQVVHQFVHAEQPILPLTTRPALDLARRRVKGLKHSPLWYDLRAAWLGPKSTDGGTR